jgi:phenylacetic acid degradation operon negative regulatory protein
MGAILDDMDSRPGSTSSLLRTVVGLYLRRLGGWIAIADLIVLLEQLGVSAPLTRTGVVRLKKKQLLVPRAVDGVAGYALNDDAAVMLQKGDRRIFSARSMGDDDAWCVISFSLPEEQRSVRHQLRRRLFWIGAGTVSPALWICPDFLAGEVEDILVELGIREHATLFRTEAPRVAGDLGAAIEEWWDVEAIAQLHRDFIGEMAQLVTDERVDAAEAFARYARGVDLWRLIPYLDPGLPPSLLPADWPGPESTRLFTELSARYAEPSWRFVAHRDRHLVTRR